MNKPWYKSKGKVGALLTAVGSVVVNLGAVLQGSMDFGTAVANSMPWVTAALGIWGLRDAMK